MVCVTAAEPPSVFRWAGDPEGGAPYVEADPAHPDEVVGFVLERNRPGEDFVHHHADAVEVAARVGDLAQEALR